MFRCQNDEMKEYRKSELVLLKRQLEKITELSTVEAITAGMVGLGTIAPSVYTEEFATSSGITNALQEQALVGWEHFLRGRIASSWLVVGPTQEYNGSPSQWAKKVVRLVIDYGIKLWQVRNKLVHGVEGGVSRQERRKVADTIIRLYEELLPGIQSAHQWMFDEPIECKLQESYHVQVAWVESVRQLFPRQYRELSNPSENLASRHAEIERHKAPRTNNIQF